MFYIFFFNILDVRNGDQLTLDHIVFIRITLSLLAVLLLEDTINDLETIYYPLIKLQHKAVLA